MQTHKQPDRPSIPLPSRRLRVLIVDDEPRLRELLLDVIPDMGFSAGAARSGEDAVRLMEIEPADIAILDLQLPLMNGIDFFRIVRHRWPATAVIILTGFGDLAGAREAIRLDVVDFLTKPFHLRDIEEALARARTRIHGEGGPLASAAPSTDSDRPVTLEQHERQLILAALDRHHGNRTAAAAELGISRRKLHYWLSENPQRTEM